MRRKKQAETNGSMRALVELADDERMEYIRRRELLQLKLDEFRAIGGYVDAYQNYLQEKYELPARFEIDLQTGAIHPAREESEVHA